MAVTKLAPDREASPPPTGDIAGDTGPRRAGVPLAVWAGLAACGAAPLMGTFALRGGARVLIPVAAAGIAVAGTPFLAERMPWRRLLGAMMLIAAAWAVSLAVVDGAGALSRPLVSRYDYLPAVPLVGSPGELLQAFTHRTAEFPSAVQAHPPGTILALWGLDRVGFGGAGWATALFIAAGASAAPAVLVAAREVAGEAFARRAAPFLVLAPIALWIATSADALYLGASAWGLALLVLATGRRGPRSDSFALGAGLVLGAALHLSYGVVPLGALVAGVALARRRVRPLLVAALGIACVTAAFVVAGFWWGSGLRTTLEAYRSGISRHRPYAAFLFLNLGAFAIALGPAVSVGLARLRDRRAWLLVGGALAAVALADVSGLSKGEVERIWLPFAPWILLACAALTRPIRERALAARGWLALQAFAALVVQVMVRSPW